MNTGTKARRSIVNKGIYCLIIKLTQGRSIKVGRLGDFPFIPGFYVYVGSAQNNLTQRIARHLRREKKAHWHIDYLLQYGKVVDFRMFTGKKQEECALSREVEKIKGATVPVKGFGSSDCPCASHLHFFPDDPGAVITKIYRYRGASPPAISCRPFRPDFEIPIHTRSGRIAIRPCNGIKIKLMQAGSLRYSCNPGIKHVRHTNDAPI